MSTIVKYGMIEFKMEADSVGFAFNCPLCHQMFFCSGGLDHAKVTAREHLQQFHRVTPIPAETVTELDDDTPKVAIQHAPQA